MFLTVSYKSGYIHYAYSHGKEVILVQMEGWANARQAQSTRSAKILITRELKRA